MTVLPSFAWAGAQKVSGPKTCQDIGGLECKMLLSSQTSWRGAAGLQ